MVTVAYLCGVCGVATDWDFSLGSVPLCVVCYDKAVDCDGAVSLAERRLRYRETHREELKLSGGRYRREHMAEVLESQRNFRLAHRVDIAEAQRKYYELKKFELREYQCRYYVEHREKVVLRMREYRRSRSGSSAVGV